MNVRSIGWVVAFAMGGTLVGQVVHPVAQMPSFDVATIKPVAEPPRSYTPSGANAVRYPYSTAMDLVSVAYGITSDRKNRVVGGPGWASTDRYGVDARIEEDLAKKIQAMPPDKAREERSLLMQSLLAERFKLKVHFETKELPVYELVVSKGGSKLKESAPVTPTKGAPALQPLTPNLTREQMMERLPVGGMLMVGGRGTIDIYGKGLKINDLAGTLGRQVGDRTVVDHTGLTSNYDFSLNWATDPGAGMAAGGPAGGLAPSGSDAPDIFTAVQEQLGLKLVPAKEQLEIVVIDQIERPSEN